MVMHFRPHQHMIVHKGMDKVRAWRAANTNPTKQNPCALAVGALPRSGKSYMGAALIHEQNKLLQAEAGFLHGARALIYTTQPTETGSTWTEVLSRHKEFDTGKQQGPGSSSAVQHSRADSTSSTAAEAPRTWLPASWVVMSKQAFDNRTTREKSRRSSARSAFLEPPLPLPDEDEDAPAADEVPEQQAEDSSVIQLAPAAAAGFEGGLKVIACDSAMRRQWQQEVGPQGRPSFDQVVDRGFDIILFDEAHLGSTSLLSKEAVQRLMAGPHTLLVLITATYVRPVGGYAVPPDRLLSWSLLDVGFARSGNLRALAERHGAEHLLGALRYGGMAREDQVCCQPIACCMQQLESSFCHCTTAGALNQQ
jgi:hypothetical protein